MLIKLIKTSIVTLVILCSNMANAEWKPDRPINIIVPWSAGGSTDQVTRIVVPILAEALGTDIVIVNQPGASGSIGTKATLDAPRDGYTWTANAVVDIATYSITGMIENTSIEDYDLFLHVANVPVVSVNADSKYTSFNQLLNAMKTSTVTVSTSGVNSAGGKALANIKAASDADLQTRMISYDGGNPAVIAAATGEVDVTTQLAIEQTEMLKAGRLRVLTVLSDTQLLIEGDPVPPIVDFYLI